MVDGIALVVNGYSAISEAVSNWTANHLTAVAPWYIIGV